MFLQVSLQITLANGIVKDNIEYISDFFKNKTSSLHKNASIDLIQHFKSEKACMCRVFCLCGTFCILQNVSYVVALLFCLMLEKYFVVIIAQYVLTGKAYHVLVRRVSLF